MERHRTVEKISSWLKLLGAIALVVYALLFFYVNIVQGQSSVDVPLVSDKQVAVKDSTVRIVDKDEIQRIVRDMAEKQKRLESRVVLLEGKVNNLESQIRGD